MPMTSELNGLAGGRSGQPVFALRTLRNGRAMQSFVLKTISEASARPRALGVGCIEANLWQAGILQTLPAPLACPALTSHTIPPLAAGGC